MLFRSAVFAALAAYASAETMIPDLNIPTTSTMGKRILSKARRLEQNNNQNQEQNDQDASWLAGYSIKYDSCASLIQVREEGGGDDEGILYTQNLVKFVVCPGNTGSCSDCGSGIAQYVVNMQEFVEAYVEMKEQQKEQACETIAEYCYCDNANDDQACENQCYVDQGMESCIEVEGQEEFNLAEYMECKEMEGAEGNNNNNNNNNYYSNNNNNNNNGVNMYAQYFIGAKCSHKDGKSIHLGVFTDNGCTNSAGSGVYEAFNYGSSLPYSSEPIIAVNECLSCLQVDEDANDNNNNNNNGNNNNNQNYNQNYETTELCQQSYEMSAKCETKLSNYLGQYFYADTSACDFINNILPNLHNAARKISGGSTSSVGGSSAATAFAVIFGLTTALLGAYSFFLYRKIHRAKVNLAQAEMGIA